MSQRNSCSRPRGNTGRTGADGVSVLPFAMVAALLAAGVAITRSVRKSRATARQLADRAAAARRGRTDSAAGGAVPSGQAAVRPTVDDDGR